MQALLAFQASPRNARKAKINLSTLYAFMAFPHIEKSPELLTFFIIIYIFQLCVLFAPL